jgi:hypothetical protein
MAPSLKVEPVCAEDRIASASGDSLRTSVLHFVIMQWPSDGHLTQSENDTTNRCIVQLQPQAQLPHLHNKSPMCGLRFGFLPDGDGDGRALGC